MDALNAIVYLISEHADEFAGLIPLLAKVKVRVFRFRSAEAFLTRGGDKTGVAIVDQQLPGMNGIALLRRLLRENSAISTILTSDTANTRLAVEAMRLGAHDVLEKPLDVGELADTVAGLNTRQRYCQAHQDTAEARAAHISLLSPRERQVFDAVTDGLSSKQIADALSISPRTIEAHRSAIKEKLGTASLISWTRVAVALEQNSAYGKPETPSRSNTQSRSRDDAGGPRPAVQPRRRLPPEPGATTAGTQQRQASNRR